jgi:thiol-disulfide isomerase/thioredoxin
MALRFFQLFHVFSILLCLSLAEDFGFGPAVAKHFVMPPVPQHVHDIAEETGKPSMVMLMSKVSPHCNMLKKSIKQGDKALALMDQFNVVYAEENIKVWQETSENYVPQVMFFSSSGKKLSIVSDDAKHKYMYRDEIKLSASMNEALGHAKGATKSSSKAYATASSSSGSGGNCGTDSCHGSKECCQLDDKEFCLETAGCMWGPQAASSSGIDRDDPDFDPDFDDDSGSRGGEDGVPCVGGPHCNGIDEKDMCEFTDGCRWTSDRDSVELESSGRGGGGSAGGGHSSDLFQPAHAFTDDIKDLIIDQPEMTDMTRAAAKTGKPFMVLLTTSWCDACKSLVDSINSFPDVKKMLPSFVVGHAHGDTGIMRWQPRGQDYVPQVHFFGPDGKPLEVVSQNEQFKHFFGHATDISSALEKVLRKVGAETEL